MLLNAFVPAYIDGSVRGVRDYTGARGWVNLTNLLLRKLENKKLFHLGKMKTRGVEVDDDYWITIPTDLRKAERIFYPPSIDYRERDVNYRFEMLNGRLRLEKPFDKKASPDSFTLSSPSTTQISINDTDATADLWNDYLLKLTDGTFSGNGIIIKDSAAVGGGVAVLDFLHTEDTAIDSTAGYLTDQYLMLKYFGTFKVMTAAAEEIPIDDRYEDILVNWLNYQALPAKSKGWDKYKAAFEEDLEDAEDEENTPEDGNASADARPLDGFMNLTNYATGEFDYEGDNA